MAGRTLHFGKKGHLPGKRLRTQSEAPFDPSCDSQQRLVELTQCWTCVRAGSLTVRWNSRTWLCFIRLCHHCFVNFYSTQGTTTFHHAGPDSFWFPASNGTWHLNKAWCWWNFFSTKSSNSSFFLTVLMGCYNSSPQILLGLPALVVTVVWGSSVDPVQLPLLLLRLVVLVLCLQKFFVFPFKHLSKELLVCLTQSVETEVSCLALCG